MPLEQYFPNLRTSDYSVTSPQASEYNCIAWAASEDDRWWWPSQDSYWPKNVPVQETLEAFIKAYETVGYETCDNPKLEMGVEKIAIYVNDNGKPSHASRQLQSGKWTSKLGNLEDIEHTLAGLEGSSYGTVTQFMKRSLKVS